MTRETEAKVALAPGEISALRARLLAVGARRGPVDDELNLVFNLVGVNRRLPRRRLRLRTFGGRPDAVLTCKGPAEKDSEYKSREETEVHVSDAESARRILEQLGFRPKTRYVKRREHWYLDDAVIALDRLAFGDFLEVEAEEPAIAATLSMLGLADRPHLRVGYARLSKRSAKSAPRKAAHSVPLATAL